MREWPHAARRWLVSLQGKLIIASLLVSLVPTSTVAELTVRLLTGVIDRDVQSFLHETSLYFLNSFKESQIEASGLARFLYEQQHSQGQAVVKPDSAFLRLADALGYEVVIVYDKDRQVAYSNYPVQGFKSMFADGAQTLYAVRLPDQTQAMIGGTFPYEVDGKKYEILVGTWLDSNFIDNLQSITTLDLRLYYRGPDGFQMIYSSRSETASGSMLPKDAAAALGNGADSYYDPLADDGNYRVVYLPIRGRNNNLIGVMSSGLRASEAPATGDLPLGVLFSVLTTGALLTGVAGVFVSRRLSRPLRALAKGVKSITAGDYGHRVDADGNDEVAELARVFNHMAERLGQLHTLEAELRRRDRLYALGEVAVGIAHEVRNPLGTIKTSTELVRRREGLNPADAKLLGYVIDEVRRIDGLIEEFLSFARPRQPMLRPLPFSTVIHRVGEFCEPEMSRHNIALTIVDDSLAAMVLADEDHLFQACLNLILNAIDAMTGGGTLTIRLKRQDGSLHTSFSDTGPGIPPDIQDKIYNPFFTTKPRGTGLGLAKVFAVMESHRGRVECVSRPGTGATFTLILPIDEGKVAHGA